MPLQYEKKDAIAYLTLNRPEAHNAIDPETVMELVAAWEDYRDDDRMRCAIITGAGDASFCAGADLGKLIPLFTGARQPETEAEQKIQADPTLAMRAFLRDFELYKPVVAAVNGTAIAGGFELLCRRYPYRCRACPFRPPGSQVGGLSGRRLHGAAAAADVLRQGHGNSADR